MVVNGGDGCRGEVEQKAVEDQMVKPAPLMREGAVRIVAARPAAFEVSQTEGILRRPPEGAEIDHVGEAAGRVAPEFNSAEEQDRKTVERENQEGRSHRQIRDHPVEGAFPYVSAE